MEDRLHNAILAVACIAGATALGAWQLMQPQPVTIQIVFVWSIIICLVALALSIFFGPSLHHWKTGLDWIRNHRLRVPWEIRDATAVAHIDKIASIEWEHGLEDSRIDRPWRLKAKLEFLQSIDKAGVYAKWGRYVVYINAASAWSWSKQTTLLSDETCHVGREVEFEIAEVQPNSSTMTILGGTVQPKRPRGTEWVCIELMVAAGASLQKERRYYAVVNSDQVAPILIDDTALKAAGNS